MYFRNAIHSFSWGVITAGMSLIFQLFAISIAFPLSESSITIEMIEGSILLLATYVFIEESFKYLIVSKKINTLSYGKGFILNAWLAGLGFSMLELFIIYQKSIYTNMDFTSLDLLKTSLLHMLTFGIFGYVIAVKEKRGLNLKVLLFNIVIHLIYNYSILFLDYYSDYITSGIIIGLFLINIIQLLIVNKKLASD